MKQYYITKRKGIYFIWSNDFGLIGQSRDMPMIRKIMSEDQKKRKLHSLQYDQEYLRILMNCFKNI